MKSIVVVLLALALFFTAMSSAMADGMKYGPGPAPNYHDGISDGPGW